MRIDAKAVADFASATCFFLYAYSVCKHTFSLYSGAIFESIVIKFDSRLGFDRESFVYHYLPTLESHLGGVIFCDIFFNVIFRRRVTVREVFALAFPDNLL